MKATRGEDNRMQEICLECRRILQVQPNSRATLKRLAYALWLMQDYPEVEVVATRILELDPVDVDWLYSRAMARLGMGKIAEAENDLICARGVTTEPRVLAVVAEALQSIGDLRTRQEDGEPESMS